MLKNWLKYSGLWAGIVFNPYHWQFKINNGNEGLLEDEPACGFAIYLGPVWIRGVIDNGSW
jgi:hypothetical protein